MPEICGTPRPTWTPDGGVCNHPPSHVRGHSWADPGPPEEHQPPAQAAPAAPPDVPELAPTAPAPANVVADLIDVGL